MITRTMKAQANARPMLNFFGSGGSTSRTTVGCRPWWPGEPCRLPSRPPQFRSDESARVTRYWTKVMTTSTISSATDMAEA